MQIWAESGKSALPICNYSQILYQFLTFTQNLKRSHGFGNLKYAMGNFKNDIFGDYIRYTHASCHSYVVMNIDGKILVVNGENDAETKEIYQRISEKVSKERK